MNSIDVLLKEYDALRQEILATINSRISILSFGLGTIGLLLTVGMTTNALSNSSLVSGLILFLLVPAVTNFVLFMWLGEYQRMQRAGRFIAGLEARINRIAKEELSTKDELLTWESNLRSARQHMKYPYNTTVMLLTLISLISLLIGEMVLNLSINWTSVLTIVGIIIHAVIYIRVVSSIKRFHQ